MPKPLVAPEVVISTCPMKSFRCPLGGWLRWAVEEEALRRLEWKELTGGLWMSRLERSGKAELVLYRVPADGAADAFKEHLHPGGEFYLVLRGAIEDETGSYRAGDLVYLGPGSVHTPRAVGETLVLVLWPEGVELRET
jgi:anti-sigma factor ChrR (cupin superfamily)